MLSIVSQIQTVSRDQLNGTKSLRYYFKKMNHIASTFAISNTSIIEQSDHPSKEMNYRLFEKATIVIMV